MNAKNQILAYCQNDPCNQIQDDNYVTITVPKLSISYASSVIRHETSYGFIGGKTYTVISDTSCVPIDSIYGGQFILSPKSYRCAFVAPKNMNYIDIYYRKYATIGSSVTYKFPKKVIILEGDYTNVDIPYFEGMQSAKKPVLSTSNEDGTKTNILTVNEDVTLRGIGDVQDELDLLTGEVIERVGEMILKGGNDENWILTRTKDNTLTFRWITNYVQTYALDANVVCDKLSHNDNVYNSTIDEVGYTFDGAKILYIGIDKNLLSTMDATGFKTYLSNNPITFCYKSKEKSIKTVDLKTINEKGETTYFMPLEGTMNVQSSGEIIPPTFDMTVPVEATTQNLASFIDLEMRNNHE